MTATATTSDDNNTSRSHVAGSGGALAVGSQASRGLPSWRAVRHSASLADSGRGAERSVRPDSLWRTATTNNPGHTLTRVKPPYQRREEAELQHTVCATDSSGFSSLSEGRQHHNLQQRVCVDVCMCAC